MLTRGGRGWGRQGSGKRDKWWWKEPGVVNTQYNIEMMYDRIVPLKHIILLTNITPINSINKKRRAETEYADAMTKGPGRYFPKEQGRRSEEIRRSE